jgi:hypothetical protein
MSTHYPGLILLKLAISVAIYPPMVVLVRWGNSASQNALIVPWEPEIALDEP